MEDVSAEFENEIDHQKNRYILGLRIALISRTDKNLNAWTVEDSQELTRTRRVLDQSLHVPLLASHLLDQFLPVLGKPGDTLPRTGTRKDPKQIKGL